jgi:hypothetical protein
MKTMLKIKNVLMCLMVGLLLSTCAKKTEDKDVTAKIFYPEKDIYNNIFGFTNADRDNLLYNRADSSNTPLKLKTVRSIYTFTASIPGGQSLKVIIRNKSDFLRSSNPAVLLGSPLPWTVYRPTVGWLLYPPQTDDYDRNLNITTLQATGPVKATADFSVALGYNGGVGRADIEIYENDAQEPTRIVKVTW